MRWGKVILVVQAVITLIIGIVLLSQVLEIDDNINNDEIQSGLDLVSVESIQQRLFQGSYILVLISAIELIIIWRLLK